MNCEWLNRTEILLGQENLERLRNARVTVVGLGGVGSYACESLVRAGIGRFQIIDFDKVSVSNLNRQILALNSTLGLYKTQVMKNRMLDINPDIKVEVFSEFLSKENRLEILDKSDYILDAIDSIGPKMGMIKDLCSLEIPFISVLGAGNRINPETVKITSIWKTSGCPLAKRLRKLLRRYDVKKDFPVVFSEELPLGLDVSENEIIDDGIDFSKPDIIRPGSLPKSIIGSISYMPAIMGMMAASKVIRDIIKL